MSAPKKVYVHAGDMVNLMIVPECFSRDAAGYKEQTYPQNVLIRLHDVHAIAFADPIARQVNWDGSDRPKPRADLCDPTQDERVKALVEAASYAAREIQDYIDDDTGIGPIEDARDTLRAALRALEQGEGRGRR